MFPQMRGIQEDSFPDMPLELDEAIVVHSTAAELARLQQQADGLRLSEEACLRTIRALKSNLFRLLGCGTTKCTFASADTIVKFPNPDHPKWKVQTWRNSTGSWQLINMRGVIASLLDPRDVPRVLGICSGHTQQIAWRDWVQDRANYVANRTRFNGSESWSPHSVLQHSDLFLLRHVPFWLEELTAASSVQPQCNASTALQPLEQLSDDLIHGNVTRVVDIDHFDAMLTTNCTYAFIDRDISCAAPGSAASSGIDALDVWPFHFADQSSTPTATGSRGRYPSQMPVCSRKQMAQVNDVLDQYLKMLRRATDVPHTSLPLRLTRECAGCPRGKHVFTVKHGRTHY